MPKDYELLCEKDDSQGTLLQQSIDQAPKYPTWRKEKLIIISEATVIVILLAVVIAQSMLSGQKHYRRGFVTDFGTLGDSIPFRQQAFINPLRPTSDFSALKMEWKDNEPRYTGPPTPDLDKNWDKLLSMTTFNISGDAAKPAVGNTYQYSDGKYAMGLEVFHALHCINNIRMMMYPETYVLNEPKDETELHKAHCLDYLRQYVQCNADLTPFWGDFVPRYRLILRPYTPHTCRDFGSLTNWISKQG